MNETHAQAVQEDLGPPPTWFIVRKIDTMYREGYEVNYRTLDVLHRHKPRYVFEDFSTRAEAVAYAEAQGWVQVKTWKEAYAQARPWIDAKAAERTRRAQARENTTSVVIGTHETRRFYVDTGLAKQVLKLLSDAADEHGVVRDFGGGWVVTG
jgi:hypothetical protein